MADITAIILTKNEEKNIGRCLKSIEKFAKRRVVIDSGSTDDTVKIARELGADVYEHPFECYARQFNWGIDNCGIDTMWSLRLDADECFSPELCEKLEALLAEHAGDDVNGVTMEANFYFLGRHIKHGGPKKRKTMIFRTGFGRIEDRHMDEHTQVEGGRVIAIKERFEHYDFKDLDSWVAKMNSYANGEVLDYFENIQGESAVLQEKYIAATRKKKFGFYYKLPMMIRCYMLFVYAYIFKLGFLDGMEGFIYHWMYQRWYRSLVDAKIYERLKMGEEK